MAGAFTHFMICSKAIERINLRLDTELFGIMSEMSKFMYLGSVSPDVPYLSFNDGNINWADVMHTEKTNGTAIACYRDIEKDWFRLKADPKQRAKLAWLFGFISHLVADAVIHPIIEAAVGPYHESDENKKNHRICEMTQDPLIFKAVRNQDINQAEFSSVLKFGIKSKYLDDIIDLWEPNINDNYSEIISKPNPSLWFKTYSTIIDLIEDGKRNLSLSRHIGKGFIYQSASEIEADSDLYQKYYANIKLPGGGSGNFYEQGFLKAVGHVVDIWNELYLGMGKGIDLSKLIKNWNLDDGTDLDFLSGGKTFWEIMI